MELSHFEAHLLPHPYNLAICFAPQVFGGLFGSVYQVETRRNWGEPGLGSLVRRLTLCLGKGEWEVGGQRRTELLQLTGAPTWALEISVLRLRQPGSLSSLQDMPWPGHMPFGSPAGMIYPLEPPTGGMEQLKLRPLSLVVSLASHHFWICVAQVRIFRALWTQRGYSEWSLLRRIQL